MMKYNMKISYRKHWGNDGTVYNQRITITTKAFTALMDAVHAEIVLKYPRKEEYINTSGYEMYLEPLLLALSEKKFYCYLNHTQTRFINLFLKLPLKNRNTYLLIKG